MNQVAIASPGYPGQPGGVTDHTVRLVQSWTDLGMSVRVFGDVSDSVDSILDRLQSEHVEALLMQYVPFLYGRRGLSRQPENLAVSCQAVGIKVTTFVHEPWVPPTRLPWLVLSPLQKRQLRRICSVSDSVVTAVPKWATTLGPKVKKVFVGSTLGDLPNNIEFEPGHEAPVVFSPFASGLRWAWIKRAVHALGTGLIVVGSDRETVMRHPVVGRHAEAEWDYRGHIPGDEVLRLLARARFVLAPFVDGLTGRRTSAMAALSCGSRLLTSSGHLWDPALAAGAAIVAGSSAEFTREATCLWKEEDSAAARIDRISWYEEHLAPTELDRQLLTILAGKHSR